MTKKLLGIFALLLSVMTTSVGAQTFKLSGGLREMLCSPAVNTRGSSSDGERIDVIMKVTDGGLMAAVCADYGMTMITDLGNIAVVSIPLDRLQAAAADERVVRIEKEGGFHLCLDEARTTANVNPISNGQAPLTQAYTGKGVIVGVIDGGIQYDHPTFMDANGKTRFRKVWDYDNNEGQPVAVMLTNPDDIVARKFSYQTKYGLYQINHASHVAGIAAGRGSANVPYRGMAPESDIVYSELLVNPFAEDAYQQYSDALLTSVKNMMDYAAEKQQPIVINISLGNNLAFSTETKLLQEAFAALTGPGRIIVAANGNEGNISSKSYLHSGNNLTETVVLQGTAAPATFDAFWKTGGTLTLKLNVKIGDDSQDEEIATAQLVDGKITPIERSSYTLGFIKLDDAPDGKQVYKLMLRPNKSGGALVVTASVTAEKPFELFCKMMPIASVTPAEGCTLSTAYSSAVPSVFPNVIGVANYCNRVLPSQYYIDPITGEKTTDVKTGEINPNSSWGPAWDGRNKPDVSAPGSIISSGNWYYARNDRYDLVGSYDIPGSEAKETWVGMSGTSQASPAVAGIVALWLEAKPDITPDDILKAIRKTAKAIEPIPNNHSGAGVIDAYAGLLEILGLPTAIPEISMQQPKGVAFRIVGGQLYADGAEDGATVTIYNLSGVAVYKGVIAGGSVSLAGLKSGIYAVQIGKQGSTLIRL